jgi:hypothetical protein
LHDERWDWRRSRCIVAAYDLSPGRVGSGAELSNADRNVVASREAHGASL